MQSKVLKEMERWFQRGNKPHQSQSLHQRISNRGIMQETHYLMLGYKVKRVMALRGRNELGQLKVIMRGLGRKLNAEML